MLLGRTVGHPGGSDGSRSSVVDREPAPAPVGPAPRTDLVNPSLYDAFAGPAVGVDAQGVLNDGLLAVSPPVVTVAAPQKERAPSVSPRTLARGLTIPGQYRSTVVGRPMRPG
jgi:hypothetical protein